MNVEQSTREPDWSLQKVSVTERKKKEKNKNKCGEGEEAILDYEAKTKQQPNAI